MPPKRAASGTAANRPAKKSKTAAAPAPKATKSNRWSAVSASANIDADFKKATENPEKAYSWMCICPPSWTKDEDEDEDENDVDDDDDDGDDEDESDEEEDDGSEEDEDNSNASRSGRQKSKTKCDNGKTCLCYKPAHDHPEHDWVITYAGFRKWIAQFSMGPVRCPDVFDMYTYNDPYGILEVIENLFLDFEEAGSWKDQWVICEGLVMFALGPGSEFSVVDDGERADIVAQLMGRMFLTMLARLEREQLLQDQNSEVKNLGLIMALFIKLASELRGGSLLEDGDEETVKKSSPRFKFKPSEFDGYILAYANKFAITLRGPIDIDELVAELDTDAKLPASGQDPWGWNTALKSYSKDYAISPPMGGGKATIGGDSLDITTWSSAERKRHAFNKKDPLTKKDLDALKAGMVMQAM